MLDGIFASLYTTSVTASAFLAVCLLSVGLGYGIALTYRKISGEGGTMFSALTVLPFLVQLVILLVNGNLGAGVAVAGAFSLVRFRSAPGSARDITVIFLSMTVGLCCGMGYWAPAVLAALVTCGLLLLQKKPQTDPCEVEPLEESTSDTRRKEYGNSSTLGMTGSSARSASAPCPISRRPGPLDGRVSPTE